MILPDGTPVYISPFLGPRPAPVRAYKYRSWMSIAHHQRVQKKWNKRYGTEIVDNVFMTKHAIFVSKQGYEKLRAAIVGETVNACLFGNKND